MSSQSTSDGKLTLTITFALGTDLDNAQVQVQNRVTRTEPKLPEEVTRLGITVDKASPDLTMVVHLTSPDNRYDMLYLSNYAVLNVKDELARLDGVGDVQLFGLGDYSLRVWLDPNKVASRNLTATDVVNAIREQNRQVAAGTLGAPPAPSDTSFQLSINTQGRLVTEEEFENIIIRAGANGEITRLRDIARVELGSNQYALRSLLNNKPAVAIPIFQRPGSNAIEISNLVREKMAELKHSFPQGMDYSIVYDPTIFVRGSIEAVVHTLFEALVLVVLVVILFLQTWRASIIPLAAVPVSLIGTFAVMHMLGFSLNALSLFGLVLAIGIVVDDAIVVVENVERNIGLGLKPVEATKRAMREVTGPIIATALVLCAVFIPTAFISGLTGQFYRQFALTIAISTVISAFNSLTLSPALAAVLLKGHHEPKDRFSVFLDKLLGSWLFRPFNRFFDRASHGYVGTVNRVLRGSSIALLVYGGLMVLTCFGFSSTPTGFVPQQDKQYLVAFAQLPDAASLDRTEAVIKQMSEIALAQPGVADSVAFPACRSTASPTARTAASCSPAEAVRRAQGPEPVGRGHRRRAERQVRRHPGRLHRDLPPPPVQGLGTIGGFRLQIEDRGNQGYEELFKQTQNIITKARALPELEPSSVFSSYQVNVPQIDADIDREKAKTHGVAISDIFDTLQVYLGSLYANDFNRFGRTYQVNVQAEQQFRLEPEQIGQLKVRNNLGEMVPLASFIKVSDTSGPDRVMHYNGFITAELNGAPAAGCSSGQARAAIELLKEELPNGMTYEWTELTYQQILAGNTALFVFPLCVLLAFLVLAAQYELEPAAGGDPDRADDPAVGDHRGDPGRQRQQHLYPDRPDRSGGAGVQERDPDRRVRQGQAGGRHGPRRRGAGSLPPAPAADPDDVHRLHHGRGAAGDLHRRRRRDAPCDGRGGVLRDDRGDLLRPAADAGVLRPHPPLRGEPRSAAPPTTKACQRCMHDSRAVDPERARVRPGSVQSAGAQRLHGGSDYRTPTPRRRRSTPRRASPTTAAASKACGGNSSTIRP